MAKASLRKSRALLILSVLLAIVSAVAIGYLCFFIPPQSFLVILGFFLLTLIFLGSLSYFFIKKIAQSLILGFFFSLFLFLRLIRQAHVLNMVLLIMAMAGLLIAIRRD